MLPRPLTLTRAQVEALSGLMDEYDDVYEVTLMPAQTPTVSLGGETTGGEDIAVAGLDHRKRAIFCDGRVVKWWGLGT